MRCGMNGLIEGLKMDAIFYTNGIYKTASRLAYYKEQAEKYPGKPWQYWKRNIWETPSNARGDKGQMRISPGRVRISTRLTKKRLHW